MVIHRVLRSSGASSNEAVGGRPNAEAVRAYFGDYGSQLGDGVPATDRARAQRQMSRLRSASSAVLAFRTTCHAHRWLRKAAAHPGAERAGGCVGDGLLWGPRGRLRADGALPHGFTTDTQVMKRKATMLTTAP